jgi:hypothetical protein
VRKEDCLRRELHLGLCHSYGILTDWAPFRGTLATRLAFGR